jgi:enoyl-CoA hydratase
MPDDAVPGEPQRQFIGYEASDRIATITLDRPEAANAQTPELLDQLDAAWQRAADDDNVPASTHAA